MCVEFICKMIDGGVGERLLNRDRTAARRDSVANGRHPSVATLSSAKSPPFLPFTFNSLERAGQDVSRTKSLREIAGKDAIEFAH